MSISIGTVRSHNRVFLAPLSGVTDEPFRIIAHDRGAGLVVSEMVASEMLVRERRDIVRRTRGAKRIKPFVIQLAGREAKWMSEGARIAEDLGADVIDINMGCPAREVTGALSGSALMRNLDHAESLISATVDASSVPVTLKMRLGWDHNSLNAPELASRAEKAGVKMITVHGRTRCQFYSGKADWAAIRRVRDVVTVPLIANGDCATAADAREMMQKSGADGVMIGRGAYGRPWWPGVIAEQLEPGSGMAEPSLELEAELVLRHFELMMETYGNALGNKTARKHLGWTLLRLVERGHLSSADAADWRKRLLCNSDNAQVAADIRQLYAQIHNERVAA